MVNAIAVFRSELLRAINLLVEQEPCKLTGQDFFFG